MHLLFWKMLGLRALVEVIVETGAHFFRKWRKEERELDKLMNELRDDTEEGNC